MAAAQPKMPNKYAIAIHTQKNKLRLLTINIGHLANYSKQKNMNLNKHFSRLKVKWIGKPNAPYCHTLPLILRKEKQRFDSTGLGLGFQK